MIFNLNLILLLLIFIFGLYFYSKSYNNFEPMSNKNKKKKKDKKIREDVEISEDEEIGEDVEISQDEKISKPEKNASNECYNMLIEKDGKYVLFNSKIPKKDGYNPLEFNNLDEYIEFVEKQENMNKQCPVLYLQYTTDAQNNDLIVVKPSLFENNGGLNSTPVVDDVKVGNMYDATLDSNPNKEVKFNTNMYSGFDQHNQNIGTDNPLDKIFNEASKISRNPIDPHWGGKEYTENAIKRGDYKEREVYKRGN